MYIAFTVNNHQKGNPFTKSYLDTAISYKKVANNKHEYVFEVEDGNERRVEFLEKVLSRKAKRLTEYNVDETESEE